MSEQSPVVIVGAGLTGAAAAWSLTRRGVPVTVLEQFGVGHDRGSSHGSSRIVRRAYGDALYVSLTGRAFELWREVELASDQQILRMMGSLDLGPDTIVSQIAGHLADAGVAHEVIAPAQAEQRWPGMRFPGEVVFHPQGGTMDAALAVRTMLDLAAVAGADVRPDTAARAIRRPGSVELADGSQLTGRCVIVAVGAWAGPLLDDVVDLPPMRVTQQAVWHLPRLDPDAPAWPSVIHRGERDIYHLAGGRDGGPSDDRKIGDHGSNRDTTAAGRDGVVDPAGQSRIVDYVQRWLPGLDPTPRNATTCLYTRTPSEDFVLDRVEDLVIASPCSGHGAKFAPLVGEYLADLATGGDTTGPIPDRFRLAAHAAGRAGAVSL